MTRTSATWILFFILLLPQTAAGFFGSLDSLQAEFEKIESGGEGEELTEILNQLDEVSGTVRFKDVPDGAWFHRYVSSVARWKIVSGYKDTGGNPTGNFGPGNPVTVAEILKMAYGSSEKNTAACTAAPRHSEAANHWASIFVACAEEDGVRLIEAGASLNRPATRAEVLSVIHDVFKERVPPLLSSFTDTAGHGFESDIAFAAAMGIVTGDKDADGNPTGMFRPDDNVNRAEAAKIIYEKLRVKVLSE